MALFFLRGTPLYTQRLLTGSRMHIQHSLSVYNDLSPRHITRVDADIVKGALKLADRAVTAWSVMRTKFLSPLAVRAVLNEIEALSEVSSIAFGGYPHAERCRVLIMRDELIDTHKRDLQNISEVIPVQVSGNFLLLKAAHSDFLGAFSGIGLKSDDIGDVVVQQDTGCLTFATPESATTLEKRLQFVRSVPVKAQRVAYDDITLPEPHVKEIKTVEASMRLDALASAAFGIARDKMVERIKSGDVQVNWDVMKKPNLSLEEGDTISCRNKGRAEIKSFSMTQKMKFSIRMVRYT